MHKFSRRFRTNIIICRQISHINKFFMQTDDQRLTTFLRGCKFSLEKVKQKLDMYYSKYIKLVIQSHGHRAISSQLRFSIFPHSYAQRYS